jgi:hypothetical protein
MKLISVLVGCLLLLGWPAYADQITYGGQGPTGHTATQVTAADTSTLITLTAASGNITLVNDSATNVFFSPLTAAATTGAGSFPIYPSSSWTYQGVPLTTFYLISASGSVTIGVDAH